MEDSWVRPPKGNVCCCWAPLCARVPSTVKAAVAEGWAPPGCALWKCLCSGYRIGNQHSQLLLYSFISQLSNRFIAEPLTNRSGLILNILQPRIKSFQFFHWGHRISFLPAVLLSLSMTKGMKNIIFVHKVWQFVNVCEEITWASLCGVRPGFQNRDWWIAVISWAFGAWVFWPLSSEYSFYMIIEDNAGNASALGLPHVQMARSV